MSWTMSTHTCALGADGKILTFLAALDLTDTAIARLRVLRSGIIPKVPSAVELHIHMSDACVCHPTGKPRE
jgi:hypothetical protein